MSSFSDLVEGDLRGAMFNTDEFGESAEYLPTDGEPRTVRIVRHEVTGEREQRQHHEVDAETLTVQTIRTNRDDDGTVVEWGVDEPRIGDTLFVDGRTWGFTSIVDRDEFGHTTKWTTGSINRHGSRSMGL